MLSRGNEVPCIDGPAHLDGIADFEELGPTAPELASSVSSLQPSGVLTMYTVTSPR